MKACRFRFSLSLSLSLSLSFAVWAAFALFMIRGAMQSGWNVSVRTIVSSLRLRSAKIANLQLHGTFFVQARLAILLC